MSLDLSSKIRDVPDFPKEGIVFKDVMPLIADPEYFRETIRRLAEWSRPRSPDLILGMPGKSLGQQQDRCPAAHDHGARNFSALA